MVKFKIKRAPRGVEEVLMIERLTPAQRDLMIEHLDGAAVVRSAPRRFNLQMGLIRSGLACWDDPVRPARTILTAAGRDALAALLADEADVRTRETPTGKALFEEHGQPVLAGLIDPEFADEERAS